MKKQKWFRWCSLLLVLLFTVALIAGCGGGSSQKAQGPSTTQPGEKQPQQQASQEKKEVKFPEKPITLIIPYEPGGGGNDVCARTLVQYSAQYFPQPIVPVNKPGAAGAVGYKELKNSKPDGYTIGLVTNSVITHKMVGNLDFDYHDFEPVITLNYEPTVIAVGKDKPWKTINEFVDYAKKNPGKVKVATSAPGGGYHMALSKMIRELGLQINVVTEGGGGAVNVQMAAGGHVDAACVSLADTIPQVKAGNLRILAVMSDKRSETFPDVPTFKESGYNVTFAVIRAFMAPKGTPKEVIDILYQGLKKGSEDPKFKEYLKENGFYHTNLGGQDFMKFFDDYAQLYHSILSDLGMLKEQKEQKK